MVCTNCGSENVTISRVSVQEKRKRTWKYWVFFGWAIDLALFIFLTIPFLIFKWLFPAKTKTSVYSEAVCQSCGHGWRV